MILNPTITLSGAADGVDLCIRVIVPSLFPYFIITCYLNSWLLGFHIPGLHHLAKLLHIPNGGDSILLLGLIGGYPVGAQIIADTYYHNSVTRKNAHILLGYCNNAGPAFIFGVTSCLFSSVKISWLLWGIQILSIVFVGLLLPKPDNEEITIDPLQNITIISALQKSIHNILGVCGWIILFKILISYIGLILTNQEIALILSGFLELSNGCTNLIRTESEPLRLLLCSVFLSFGGICVLMQTRTAVSELGLGYYLPGKILQTSVSLLLSILAAKCIYNRTGLANSLLIHIILIDVVSILLVSYYCKKSYRNSSENGI